MSISHASQTINTIRAYQALNPPRTFIPDTHLSELHITQKAFRTVMDAMARPGLMGIIPSLFQPTLANPFLETLTQMLIDSTCTLCAVSEDRELMQAISRRNGARQVAYDQARFAVISVGAPIQEAAHLLATLSGGTDESPERGATAIIECQELGAPDTPSAESAHLHTQWFCVTGPGVETENSFCASNPWWYEVRKSREDEFPCGIEVVLVDVAGRMVALPRTAKLVPAHKPEGR